MGEDADSAHILLAEPVGWWPVIDTVLADRLPRSLKSIHVDLNTPGGDYFVGLGIYNFLRTHPARVTTRVTGEASSVGSVIFLAGDERVMAENAMVMIHNPYVRGMSGDSTKLTKEASTLKSLEEAIARLYARRTKLEEQQALDLMKEETWFGAEEAMENGFAHSSEEAVEIAACRERAQLLSRYRHAPSALVEAFKPVEDSELPRASLPALSGQDMRLLLDLEEAIHT